MQTYFLYQLNDQTFHPVFIKDPLNKYLAQAKKITEKMEDVVCRWVVKKKL